MRYALLFFFIGCSETSTPTIADAGANASEEGGPVEAGTSSSLDASIDRADPLTCRPTTKCDGCKVLADCRACCESFQCADPGDACPAFDDCRAKCK